MEWHQLDADAASPLNPGGAASSSLAAVSCTAATIAAPRRVPMPPRRRQPAAGPGARGGVGRHQLDDPDARKARIGYDSVLSGVDCPTAINCIAVGYDYYNQGPQDAALAEQWDGSSWTIQPTATPSGGYVRQALERFMRDGNLLHGGGDIRPLRSTGRTMERQHLDD